MDVWVFVKAALVGLSIAAPVGPIGLLCMQRTLAHGLRVGFVSGLGAACADAVYGAIGAFGLAAVTQFFIALASPLALGGALVLAWMGWRMLRAVPLAHAAQADVGAHPLRAFISVFMLTLSNPMTILSFVAVFAAIGGTTMPDARSAGAMVGGVFTGSALWWLTLAAAVAAVRHRVDARVMQVINRLAGLTLLGLAAWQCLRLIS